MNITFVIPLKINYPERLVNYPERLVNYKIVKRFLSKIKGAEIDTYLTDDDPFHRTKYINILIKRAKNKIVAVWDADILCPVKQIKEAMVEIEAGATICYPFDGRMLNVTNKYKMSFKFWDSCNFKDMSTRHNSKGGAFLIDKEKYLECGGENEEFTGWGFEDRERYDRVKKLGGIIKRVGGCIYHLDHQRNQEELMLSSLKNRVLYRQIRDMNKKSLEAYVYNNLKGEK